MSSYEFHAYGHENVRGTHASTLEFTKDTDLTLNGDCIAGVKADFDLEELRAFLKEKKKDDDRSLRVELKVGSFSDSVEGKLNPLFNDKHEIVLRRTDFASGRTLMLRSDKGAAQLDRGLLRAMRKDGREMTITLS